MKFVLMNLATAKEPWADEVSELYRKKISHFMSMEIVSLKPRKSSRDESELRKKEEAAVILKNLNSDDYLVLLDERGQVLDSLKFAKKVETMLGSSKKRVVFLIGGPYGVTEEIRMRADLKVSLSPMVMNHLMAQAVILEQVYRAFTIIHNIPYHNV